MTSILTETTELSWQGALAPTLVVRAVEPFITAGGSHVMGVGSALRSLCTLEPTTSRVIVPTVSLPATQASIDRPTNALYVASLEGVINGATQIVPFGVFGAGFKVPSSFIPQTWEQIRMFTLGMEIEAASPLALSGATHFYDALRLTGIVDGGAVASWTDMSGNANHAVQATGTLQPIFHTADADDGLPYIAAADTADYLTVPVTADATRTIFIVAKNQGTYPTTSLISYDGNNLVSMLLSRWIGYKKSAAGHAGGIGYTAEWSVIALRQNSATSLSLFVDGVLAETFTPENANWSTLTSFKIGAGHGWIRQFAIFDRALTDTEVERQATWLRAYNGFTWEFEYIDFPGNFPPTLPSPALVVKKEGLTGSRPLVILNHQAGSTERVFRDSGNWRVIVSALVEAGYIVAMSRMWDATSFENTWGNNAALAANDDLYAHLVANHDIDTDKVAMIGASMGGLATALAFPLSAIPLKGAAFYDAVLDLAHIYPSQSAGINSAYAISGGNPYATATAGHDPRLRAASDWAGVRLRFYRNTADVTVDPTQNTADFSAQVAGVATESAVVSYAGGHLANIELTVDDLMAFLERCFT